MDVLYIVMPAYNEEANIEMVVSDWYKVLEGKSEESRLVVADCGSTDATHAILERMQKSYPKLEILSDTGKQHGPKVIALYDYAIRKKSDYIFQTDSDGQTLPEEFEKFWNSRDEYDGMFGNRRVREDGMLRNFIEIVVCLLMKLYFGVNVPDANAPFRLMKAENVKKYLYKMPSDYNLPNIMMTTYFVYYGEKVMFEPITFRPRQGGENSIDMWKIIKIGYNALGDFKKLKKDL